MRIPDVRVGRLSLCLLLAACGEGPATSVMDAALEAGGGTDARPGDSAFGSALFPHVDLSVVRTCRVPSSDAGPAVGAPVVSADRWADRETPVLVLVREQRAWREAMDMDAALQSATAPVLARFRGADGMCRISAACVAQLFTLSDADRTALVTATVGAWRTAGVLASVASRARTSGLCEPFESRSDGELLSACLDRTVQDLAALAAGRAVGEAPVAALDALVRAAAADTSPWWDPWLVAMREGLTAAGRDEPVRYEPIDDGENRAAHARLATVDLSAFPFSFVLVPGQGPGVPGVVLDPVGRLRAEAGAARVAAGLAPVLILSGGHVHPDRTPYSEALEMKRHLVSSGRLTADAILLDPYARHTTTNLRNAARLAWRHGLRLDRPALVTSDAFQSAYIAAPDFATRCRDEMRIVPFGSLRVISPNDACWSVARAALPANPSDALDP